MTSNIKIGGVNGKVSPAHIERALAAAKRTLGNMDAAEAFAQYLRAAETMEDQSKWPPMADRWSKCIAAVEMETPRGAYIEIYAK